MNPEDVKTSDDARIWLVENGFEQAESGTWCHRLGLCVTEAGVDLSHGSEVIETAAFELAQLL